MLMFKKVIDRVMSAVSCDLFLFKAKKSERTKLRVGSGWSSIDKMVKIF